MSERLTSDIIKELEEIIRENNHSITNLTDNFKEISKLTTDTNTSIEDTQETVHVIQEIAMNTRILGFNASIEASKAKESGKGFGVIAQEIRNLSDVSKNSADKIEETVTSISRSASSQLSLVGDTDEVIKKMRINDARIKELMRELKEKS